MLSKVKEFFKPKDEAGQKSLREAKHSVIVCSALIIVGKSWQPMVNHDEWYHWGGFAVATLLAFYLLDVAYEIKYRGGGSND
ncbi:hypothetical protein [Bacillus cereus]|uniref:Uncharacterized protein n=1 Tax=Bacillus cereus TaxID=1396 RepID=A0A9X8IYW1_BACCE|nr:hypothetical protein [Bacillus cereus]RWQ72966.1 hypothetical protein DR116_0016695 [Bacillus cereus]